jgi:hypothetical protein
VRHRVQVEGATYARVAGSGLWVGDCVRLSGDQGRECDGGLAVRRMWVATGAAWGSSMRRREQPRWWQCARPASARPQMVVVVPR